MWLDENGGWIAKAETSGRRTRRLDRDLYRGGVQPDSPAHPLAEGQVIGTRVRRARLMTHSRTRGAHRRTSTMAENEIVSRVTFLGVVPSAVGIQRRLG